MSRPVNDKDYDITNNNKTDLSFVRAALALASDYETVYVIDNNDDSYAEYHMSNTEYELKFFSKGDDFYADTVKNCRILVYPDDQDRFLEHFKKEKLLRSLENGRSDSVNYRLVIEGKPVYYSLKAIRDKRGDSDFIFIGVQNVDVQMRRKLADEEEKNAYSEIASSLASLYEVIYHVDINTDNYTEYSASENYAKIGLRTGGSDFFTATQNDIKYVVHPDDYEKVSKRLEKKQLIDDLRAAGSVSFTYRQQLGGKTQYVRLLAFLQKQHDDRIVVAVRNVDALVRRENAAAAEAETYSHIAKALASRYEVIYYVDLDTNAYTEYSSSEQYAKLGVRTTGKDFFAACARDVKQYIHPEDSPTLLKQLKKENLIKALNKTGSASFTYRQQLGDRSQYVTMIVVRPKNDSHNIVMGVINIDDQMRREQNMKKETETFSEIINALALRYEVIYYVNCTTGEYAEYSSSEKYAKLKIGEKGSDFFGDTQRNMKRDIYSEDYPMMAKAMTKKTVMERLNETGQYNLTYRLVLDGRPQYVTLVIIRANDDSDHIIVGVANIDVDMRRELAYREAIGSAMDMASRDALTGVKNKHAYVQAEEELDTLIERGEAPEFAVVICDVNGLKQINDTQGHTAGDEFIRSACNLICNNFKHSPVFRIGGDEFVALLKGQDFGQRDQLMEQFAEIMDENKEKGFVTVAAGISVFDSDKDNRLQDVFERADQAMYINKKYLKSK